MNVRISYRREFGLERFVPSSLIEGMKRKELRRLMAHFLKLNSQMTGSSKMLTQLQVSDIYNVYLFIFLIDDKYPTSYASYIMHIKGDSHVADFLDCLINI